jgi:hypothetical protein
MLLAFLFWLSNGESTIRLPLHMEDDLVVEVPPLQFVSTVGVTEGEEEEVDDDETTDEFAEEDEYEENIFDGEED